MKILTLIAIIIALSNSALAEEKKSWFDSTLETLGLNDNTFDESKLIDFSVIPGPFYNPEMSFGIGLSAVGLYRGDSDDKETQLSSLVINGFGSANGSFGAAIENKTFFKKDKIRLYITANTYRAVETYYGVGYETNKNDKNAQDYKRDLYEISPTLLYNILPHTFIGGGAHLNYTEANNVESPSNKQVVTNDELSFSNSYKIIGVTLKAFHDSRDFTLNAKKGRLIDLSYTYYEKSLGSDANFRKITVEWAEYYSIDKKSKNILAFQFKTEANSGEVPWDQYAKVGGSKGLRGYYEGRYRDNNVLHSQLEFRHKIKRPHGVVAWVGGAMTGESYSELRHSQVLKNFGVGYRLEVKERVNVRFDYGIGDGESGFYMNISEAF